MVALSTESVVEDGWRYNLDTYAERISKGSWDPYAWHVWLAQRLVEAVLAGNRRIVITAPPRHGKSTLASRWLPTWFLDVFPRKTVILASYSAGLVRGFSEETRNSFVEGSETWTRVDPGHRKATEWKTTEGGGEKAVSIGSGITGWGGDLVLVDDPTKGWAEAQSAAHRAAVINWFNGTLYHRLEPNATIVLIQTRWNEGDLAGYLLNEHEDDWVEYKLPALAEANDLLGRDVGEALCPERYTAERLQQIRTAIGEQVFSGLFQQRPGPAEGNIIKRDWIQYYGGPTGIDLPEEMVKQCQSWDLNFGKETTKGSFNVGQVWGKYEGFWLLDQVRGRWGFLDSKDEVRRLSRQWPQALEKYIEEKAAGAPLMADLKAEINGLHPVIPRGSKEARLEAVSGLFRSGDVWLPHPSIAPWIQEYVEELVTAPFADNDDQSDTTSQALSQMQGLFSVLDIVLPQGGTGPGTMATIY